jgi:hypothetical protein
VGAAFLVKPVALAAAPAFLAFALLCRQGRWRPAGLVAVPLVAAATGVAVYNWARFGSPLDTGYRTAAWNVAPWIGLWGLLLSSGKGLLWYCPPLVLGLAGLVVLGRRRARAAVLMGGVSLLYLLAHASYNHWHGGGSWGPRLILPVLPLVVLPLAGWIECPPRAAWARLGLALLLAAGMVLQMPAILAYPPRALQALYDRSATATAYTLRLLYRPADSPLLLQWRSLLEVAALTRDAEARTAVGEMARRERDQVAAQKDWMSRAVGVLSFNVFDLWPVTWSMLGAPVGVLLAVEGALLAAAGGAARALWRRVQ